VESGVKAQSHSPVDVATSRSNSQGVTAASSQDPETNLVDRVEGTEVEARNNMSNLIVELTVVAVGTAQNMNNAKTTIVSTRRSVGITMNGYKTTFTGSSGSRNKKGGGNRVTHREVSPVAKGQASHQKEEKGNYSPPGGEANNRSETVNSPVARARRATEGKNNTTHRPKGRQNKRRRRAKQHKAPEGKATPDARRQSNTTRSEVKDFVNYRECGKSILLASGKKVGGEMTIVCLTCVLCPLV